MLFAHLIDHIIINVFCKNEINTFIQMSKKLKFKTIQKMNYKNCFQTNIDSNFVRTRSKSKMSKDYQITLKLIEKSSTSSMLNIKTKLLNKIMIYDNVEVIKTLINLITKFS